MSIDKWTLESALDAAVDCLNRHLPGYIQARLDADAERDRPLINGKLPVPKVVTTGMLDDLAADWVTPAIFLNATSTSYQNFNASSLLDSQPRVTATILMAEGDIDTSEQRIYSNALSMYSDGVRYILSTVFPEDGGCEVGVQAATPDSVQYSPLVRPDGYPVWLRWSEVSVVWTQRVVNSWNTDPPPWDPLSLGPLVWLDPTDQSTLFIDAAGTIPVTASGDPVGLWRNKGTLGAAGNAVQTVSANRPLWTDAGGGSIMGNGELITGDATRIAPPRSLAIYAAPGVASTIGDVAGWKRGAGYEDDLSVYITGAPRFSVLRVPRGATLSNASNALVAIESSDGVIQGKTPASTMTTNVGPRGAFSVPFRVFPTDGNIVGHIFLFARELTDAEATKLLAWMEAQ